MEKASDDIARYLNSRYEYTPSPEILQLIADPGTWYHFALAPNPYHSPVNNAILKLRGDAACSGATLQYEKLPGHDGFFARVTR